jgi:hypothetical protein
MSTQSIETESVPSRKKGNKGLCRRNRRAAREKWGLQGRHPLLVALNGLSEEFALSVSAGDVILLQDRLYVTHAGLLRIARRNRCVGMRVRLVPELSDATARRFAFEATVFKSKTCHGFVGYGDADPSNVSALVQGAEMRVAETRAVNRALRKAYGVGICSAEEIGSPNEPDSAAPAPAAKKMPSRPVNGNGGDGGPKVRDRLCQLIRQHHLDAGLVKAYAVDYCGVAALRDATREQVESFVSHLGDWAEKDRNALLCQLNSYPGAKEGAA